MEQLSAFTQTALFRFLLANLGIVATITGIVGLAMGGNLPGIRIPPHLRSVAKLVLAITLMVGLTLITSAPPDLLEKLIVELSA